MQLAKSSLMAPTSAIPRIFDLRLTSLYHVVEGMFDGTSMRNNSLIISFERPEAVNISNVAGLIDANGKPHYKYIVEGANLFFTQQARLYLEKRKAILFKDSSANKGKILFSLSVSIYIRIRDTGGVTSSSLEVLAGLVLPTEEYMNLMAFKDGRPSEFYQTYVKGIQARITDNATAEFNCIWKEYARLQGAKPRSVISDELSLKLSSLQTELENSDLFDDEVPKKKAISCAVPAILLEKVGLEALMERLPIIYQRALFSSWIASQFVGFCSFSYVVILTVGK